MTSCNSNGFKVEGTVEGIEDGDTLLVMPADAPIPFDTLIVKDGKFEWEGETDSVILCSVFAPKAMTGAIFFREPGKIQLLLSATGDSKVSGTESNDALQELNAVFSEAQKKAEALMSKISDGQSQEEQMEIYAQCTDIQKQVGKTMKEMALKNLNNEFGYFLFTQLAYGEDFTKDELTETISKFPTKFQERQAIKDIQKMMSETFSTEEGQQIPYFKMLTPENQEINIMALVKENKITVFDFWASWCQPCREEMPVMKQILTSNQDKGFGIVGISIDDNEEAWTHAINELNLTWPQVSDLKGGASNIARSFDVQTIPYTVVVDQNGKILKKGLRGEELAAFISEQLK